MSTCKDCFYWYWPDDRGFGLTVPETGFEGDKKQVRMGICRRYAPREYFANSREDDWCGEFKNKTENHET